VIHQRRILGFDFLRALAVVAVVLGHVFALPGGFIGVDVFFVISGYVITLNILNSLFENRFSLLNFYRQRMARIVPPLFACSVITFLLARYVLLLPEDYESFKTSYFYQALFAQNYFFLESSLDYFRTLKEANFTTHLWSIAVEEQFYLIFPLMFAAVFALGRGGFTIKWILSLVLSGVVLIVGGVLIYQTLLHQGWYWTVRHSHSPQYYLIQFRAWELLLGGFACGVACGMGRGMRESKAIRIDSSLFVPVLLVILFISLVTCFVVIKPNGIWPAPVTLLPTLIVAILMVVMDTFNVPQLERRGLATAIPLAIGRSSYSIYLYHWPLYAALVYVHADFGSRVTDYLVYFSALAICSFLSYQFIEKRRWRFTGFQLLSCCLLYGIFQFSVFQTSPRKPEFSAEYLGQFSRNCSNCEEPRGPFVLLWGDSYARAFLESLERLANQRNLQLVFFNCASTRLDDCGGDFYAKAKRLAQRKDLVSIVMAARWSHYMKDRDDFESGLKRLVKDFGNSPLIFIKEPPRLDFYPRKETLTANLNVRLRAGPKLEKSLARHHSEMAAVEAWLVRDIKELPKARVVDPAESLCARGSCKWRDSRGLYYFDDNHLSVHGADRVVSALHLHPLGP